MIGALRFILSVILDLFSNITGAEDWKRVAEKLGLRPHEIRYLDKRIPNPAEAVLCCVAQQNGLTTGNLYDVLTDCELPMLADIL